MGTPIASRTASARATIRKIARQQRDEQQHRRAHLRPNQTEERVNEALGLGGAAAAVPRQPRRVAPRVVARTPAASVEH